MASYLPAGFSQVNILGQTWQVYVRQPESGALQVLVEGVGGKTLSPKDLVKVAGLTGDLGGFVPYDGMLGNLSSNVAQGTNWALPFTEVPGLPSPGAGRLLGNALIGSATNTTIQTNDFLYRDEVPGHPELNKMDVALDMGGNNINNAATVNAVQGVFSGDVTVADQLTAGAAYVLGQATVGNNVTVTSAGCAFNAPGTCLYGDGTNSAIRTNGGVYFQNFAGSPADTSANHAIMQAAYTGTDNGAAVVGAACSPNGALASSVDGTGTHLECVSGIWKKLGGSDGTSFYTATYNETTTVGEVFEPQLSIPNQVTGGFNCPSGYTDLLISNPSSSETYGGPFSAGGSVTTVWKIHACVQHS